MAHALSPVWILWNLWIRSICSRKLILHSVFVPDLCLTESQVCHGDIAVTVTEVTEPQHGRRPVRDSESGCLRARPNSRERERQQGPGHPSPHLSRSVRTETGPPPRTKTRRSSCPVRSSGDLATFPQCARPPRGPSLLPLQCARNRHAGPCFERYRGRVWIARGGAEPKPSLGFLAAALPWQPISTCNQSGQAPGVSPLVTCRRPCLP
jgi:hypothetical protein